MRFIIHVAETKIVPYLACNGVLNGFMRELLILGMAVINSEPYSYRVSFPVAATSDSCTVQPQCRSWHVPRPLNVHICVRFSYCKSAPVFAMSQTRVASLIALSTEGSSAYTGTSSYDAVCIFDAGSLVVRISCGSGST